MDLGAKIAELRKQRGWTQKHFASKIGVHSHHVTRWESNRMRPSSTTLQRIAEVFGVKLDDLLNNKPVVPESLAQDKLLIEKLELLRELEPEQRAVVYHIIDMYATQKRMAGLLLSQKPVVLT